MAWVVCYILIGVAGIGVLGLAGVRVYAQVRELGREVSRASSRISAAREGMPAPAPAPAVSVSSHGRERHDTTADVR